MRTSKYKLNRRALMTVLFDGAAGAAVVGGAIGGIWLIAEPAPTRGDVTLYKNPQCGCCEGYADYLHRNGFKVRAVSTNDLTIMGQKYGIPDDMQPCHISLIGGYVVGGHIPMEVIDRLLGGRPVAAYIIGVAFAFGWTPCIGPVLGAILTTSAVAATVPQGVILLGFYSLGLGLPFLAAAVFTDSLMLRLRGLRRFGQNLKLGTGAIVAGMGVAILTGQLTSFSYWLLDTFPILARIG